MPAQGFGLEAQGLAFLPAQGFGLEAQGFGLEAQGLVWLSPATLGVVAEGLEQAVVIPNPNNEIVANTTKYLSFMSFFVNQQED
ncbi:hypothetical protein [Chamaesiphon sp.]|uniref:hypothetical protein n=1 Tax=Chamaesiphon sp. TaxID=2814140 RepID=UPI0035944E45